MTIDIDCLTEADLIELNHRVVGRLRFLSEQRTHKSMLKFRVGEHVQFDADGGRLVNGVLMRFNRKSVSVLTDDGQRWNVSPALLRRVVAGEAADSQRSSNGNLLVFRK